MSQAASQIRPVVRGPSRFRVRVQLVLAGLRPYGWEIYDEEDGKTVRRSAARFRSSAEAWHAGITALEAEGGRCQSWRSPRQVERRAVVGPGVGVAAGGGEAGVADGGLHEVDGGAAVERVADMGVAQPVRRHRFWEPGALGGLLDDAVHLLGSSAPPCRERNSGAAESFDPQRHQLLPDRRLEQHSPRFAALAEQGDLAAVVADGEIAAAQGADLADPQAAEIEQF